MIGLQKTDTTGLANKTNVYFQIHQIKIALFFDFIF